MISIKQQHVFESRRVAKIRIEKLSENIRPLKYEAVTFKEMGNYTELRYGKTNAHAHTQKLDVDNYIVLETGEVKQYDHTTTRAENIISIKQSMAHLRDLIRTNVQNPVCCRWCCLTYADNMQDAEQLYEDYRRFNQRFQRYLNREHNIQANWVAIAEPQARRAWHMHIVYIFPHTAPYISNKDLAQIWGHGFTKIKALKDSDDVALYLSAYLGDIPLDEALQNGTQIADIKPRDLKIVGEGEKSKAYIKGGRIGMYPTGMRLYRCSKGIKKPVVSQMTEAEAQSELVAQNAMLTYEKTIALYESENGREKPITTYNYRLYKASRED